MPTKKSRPNKRINYNFQKEIFQLGKNTSKQFENVDQMISKHFAPRELIKDIVILNSNEKQIDRIYNFKFFSDRDHIIRMDNVFTRIFRESPFRQNLLERNNLFILDHQNQKQIYVGENPTQSTLTLHTQQLQVFPHLTLIVRQRQQQNQQKESSLVTLTSIEEQNLREKILKTINYDEQQKIKEQSQLNNKDQQKLVRRTVQPSDIEEIVKTQRIRRDKERTIEFAVQKVQEWKKVKEEGFVTDQGEVLIGLTQEQAAKVIGMSKKTLEDYHLQIRKAERRGYSIEDHLNEKMGIVRRFNKDYEKLESMGQGSKAQNLVLNNNNQSKKDKQERKQQGKIDNLSQQFVQQQELNDEVENNENTMGLQFDFQMDNEVSNIAEQQQQCQQFLDNTDTSLFQSEKQQSEQIQIQQQQEYNNNMFENILFKDLQNNIQQQQEEEEEQEEEKQFDIQFEQPSMMQEIQSSESQEIQQQNEIENNQNFNFFHYMQQNNEVFLGNKEIIEQPIEENNNNDSYYYEQQNQQQQQQQQEHFAISQDFGDFQQLEQPQQLIHQNSSAEILNRSFDSQQFDNILSNSHNNNNSSSSNNNEDQNQEIQQNYNNYQFNDDIFDYQDVVNRNNNNGNNYYNYQSFM